MSRTTLATLALSLLTAACQQAVMNPKTADIVLEESQHVAEAPLQIALPGTNMTIAPSPLSNTRAVGDYITYQFTGSYRSLPLTVTHQLVDQTDDALLFHVRFDDGINPFQLQVRVSNRDASSGEILSVAKMHGKLKQPFGIAAYSHLMAQTMLVADANEGLLGSTGAPVQLGDRETTATRTSYRVIIGKDEATLHTFTLANFPWGDAGGEILTRDGRVLYRAEVVDLGFAAIKDAAVASQVPSNEEYEDDYDIYED